MSELSCFAVASRNHVASSASLVFLRQMSTDLCFLVHARRLQLSAYVALMADAEGTLEIRIGQESKNDVIGSCCFVRFVGLPAADEHRFEVDKNSKKFTMGFSGGRTQHQCLAIGGRLLSTMSVSLESCMSIASRMQCPWVSQKAGTTNQMPHAT